MGDGALVAGGSVGAPSWRLRREATDAPASGIVEVFDHGRGRPGLIPLYVGESDLPTPAFICAAASAALTRGETFYGPQGGLPALREAIGRYMARIHARPEANDPSRFFVTVGGMHALQTAVRLVAGEGDDVVVLTPAWPNFRGALTVAGARTIEVAMTFVQRNGLACWDLDVERLEAAIGERTRAIFVNSPSNPTGWTASHEQLTAILALARRNGLWIVADEIYGRLVYDGALAVSFRGIAAPDDRIMYVQTLSKNWAMTGWRIGWLEAPSTLSGTIENLIQYSTSGVPVFLQRAAIAALEDGEPFLQSLIARLRASREILRVGLAAQDRIRFALPAGGFYVFLAIDGETDTRKLALRLIEEAHIGVAPGGSFGAGGEAFLRLCFAREPQQIEEAVRRLSAWLAR